MSAKRNLLLLALATRLLALASTFVAQAMLMRPNLAILFTSGHTRDALTTDGRLREGVQLLSKPYDRMQLAQPFREVLSARHP